MCRHNMEFLGVLYNKYQLLNGDSVALGCIPSHLHTYLLTYLLTYVLVLFVPTGT
jgi:hypothetical protein